MYRELKDSDKEKESGKMVSLSKFSLYVWRMSGCLMSLHWPRICSPSQEFCEHSIGVGGRSGGLSPSSVSANQSSEILGGAREVAQAKAGCSQNACGVEDVLQLLRILYIIGGDSAANTRTLQEGTKTLSCTLEHTAFMLLGLMYMRIFLKSVAFLGTFGTIKYMKTKQFIQHFHFNHINDYM